MRMSIVFNCFHKTLVFIIVLVTTIGLLLDIVFIETFYCLMKNRLNLSSQLAYIIQIYLFGYLVAHMNVFVTMANHIFLFP